MSASPNSQQQEQENFHSEIQQQENQIQQQDENENQQENYFPEDNEQVQFQNSGIDYSDNQQSGLQYSPSRIKNEILDSKNQSPFKNSNKDYGERYNRVIGKLKDSSNLGDLARRYNNINFPKSGSKSINNNNDSQFLQDHINFNSSRKNSPSPVKQNFLNSSLHSKLNQSASKNKNQFITNNNNNNNNFFMNSNNNNFLNSKNNNNNSGNKNFMNHSYSHSPLNTDLSRKSFIKNGGFNNPQNIELLRSSNLSIFSRKNLDSGMIPNILQDLKVSQQRLRSPNGFRASSNVFGSQIINSGNQSINLNREKICLRDEQQGLLQNRSPLKFQQKQNKLNVQSSPFGKILQKGVILSPAKNYGNFTKSPRKYQTNLNNYTNNRSPQKRNFGNYGASTGNSGLSNLLSQLKSVQKGSGNNNTGFKKNFTKFLQETHLGSPTNNRSQLQQQDLKRAIMSPLKQSSAKSPQKNQNKFDFNLNNNNISKTNNNTQNNYFSQNLLNRKQSQPTQNYPTLLQKNSSYNSSNNLNGNQGLDGLISNLQKKKSNFAAKKNTNTNYNFGKKTDLFAGITSPVNKKTSSFSNNYKKY